MTSISTNRRTISLESAEPPEEDQFNFAISQLSDFHGKLASGQGSFMKASSTVVRGPVFDSRNRFPSKGQDTLPHTIEWKRSEGENR
jgi:hypothetical protein